MRLDLYQLYQLMLEQMGATGWWPAESKQQILVEAILIQNTTETNATRASQLIKEETGYDLAAIVNLPSEDLETLVRPAGFMTNKSRAIQTMANWVLEQDENWSAINQSYGDDLRKTLLSLFGIGDETADVYLTYLFDRPQFVADKYARTLFSHLGIAELTDYKSLHRRLSQLPEPFSVQDAQEFHGLIDEFGKKYFGRKNTFSESFLADVTIENMWQSGDSE